MIKAYARAIWFMIRSPRDFMAFVDHWKGFREDYKRMNREERRRLAKKYL